ncbi:MAG: OpgC family protein [Alphaproteobacteria bacterium]
MLAETNSGVGSIAVANTGAPGVLAGVRASGRDLRLDFFRGLALIFIFIDHVPGNIFANFTLRNFGFVDAAELFVFVAGYAAALAYGRTFARAGFIPGLRRVGKRVAEIYAAHLIVLIICVGGISIAARALENPLYYEFINLVPFAYEPFEAILRVLALNHHLIYLNILPLYIVLLAWFPVLLWLLRRHPALALGASLALYALAQFAGLNLPSYPNNDGWFFNPFAWQLLFSIGAILGDRVRGGAKPLPRPRWLIGLAAAYALFALAVIAPWTKIEWFETWRLVPGDLLAPMDKTNLSPWRLMHILALAYLVAIFVKPGAAWLDRLWARGIIACGRKSLDIFCLGTVFSFVGLFVLIEAGRDFAIQAAINLGGIGLMMAAATWLSRQKAQAIPTTSPARPAETAGLSSGAPPSPSAS